MTPDTQTAPQKGATVTVDGLEIPRRFASQEALEAYAKELKDDQFGTLCKVLRSRRWTDEEFEKRIKPLRPGHSYFKKAQDAS